jgi:three-Cys-motif partner protein
MGPRLPVGGLTPTALSTRQITIYGWSINSDPPFTKLRFCETPCRARQLEETLSRDFPDRIGDFAVIPGDCNEEIPQILERLRVDGLQWAPTFAFLDPYGMQVDFDTLEALAHHKRGYRSTWSTKPEYKVEPWLSFPSAAINRVAAARSRHC